MSGYTVDWPDAEYHQVLPNLYLGGHVWEEGGRSKSGKHSTISEDKSWDYVVSSYLDGDYEKTLPQCDMRLVLFNDTEKGLSEEIWEKIRSAVDEIVSRWRRGQKVLVRCQAGYNRSGMLMCLTLMQMGLTAEDAIKTVRKRRGQHVLINRVFEGYVREREVEYRDQASLAGTMAIAGDLL